MDRIVARMPGGGTRGWLSELTAGRRVPLDLGRIATEMLDLSQNMPVEIEGLKLQGQFLPQVSGRTGNEA